MKATNVKIVQRSGFTAAAPLTAKQKAEIEEKIANFSGLLKLYMGACNNAAYLVMGNAFDNIRKTKMWRTKFHKGKGKFKQAIKAWHDYEYQLLHADYNRMFHLADYSNEVRKKYGDISDQEYYDYWCTIGSFAYEYSRDELNSLRYKYKKVLISHGVEDEADLYADAMVAQIMLNLCVEMLDVHIESGVRHIGLQKETIFLLFKDLSLARVRNLWNEALRLALPDFMKTELDKLEDRNVEMGISQLAERMADEKMLYHALNDATEDYQEVFRTEGEWKKALKQIRDTRKELL